MSNPVTLQFAAPRRGKPPVHFADLSTDERKDAVRELGQPSFRAKQLSTHYFDHLTVDPEDMTDLPAGAREGLVGALFPSLMSPVRSLEADGGATRKTRHPAICTTCGHPNITEGG